MAGPDLRRRLLGDLRASRLRVGVGQQDLERCGRQAVAVVGVAVRQGQLERLHDAVDSVGGVDIEVLLALLRQDGQALEQRRALAPRTRLVDLVPAEAQADRSLVVGAEATHVLGVQDTAVDRAGGVDVGGVGHEAVDRLGDEATPPDRPGGVDHRGAARPGSGLLAGLLTQATQGRGPGRVGHQRARLGGAAVQEPACGRARPVRAEQLSDLGDHGGRPGAERLSHLGVVDRVGEDVLEGPAAVIGQQQQPGVDGAGDRRCQRPRAGHRRQTLVAEVRDGGAPRRRTLSAEDGGYAVGRADQGDQVAAGTVEVRLDEVEHECAGDGRVKGVAAALEDRLGDGGGDPVRRRAGAEGTLEVGSGEERRFA